MQISLCCELHSNLVSLHSETTIKVPQFSLLGCELHSNLVSLHSETTRLPELRCHEQLWITFKSCIFAFWNNSLIFYAILRWVVNYIQILYLCILKQHLYRIAVAMGSCELHSNLVSLHSETTIGRTGNATTGLWITFKSCIFAFWNNKHCRIATC